MPLPKFFVLLSGSFFDGYGLLSAYGFSAAKRAIDRWVGGLVGQWCAGSVRPDEKDENASRLCLKISRAATSIGMWRLVFRVGA